MKISSQTNKYLILEENLIVLEWKISNELSDNRRLRIK